MKFYLRSMAAIAADTMRLGATIAHKVSVQLEAAATLTSKAIW